MKPRWKQYLLYASLIIIAGGFGFILVETVRAKNTGFETKTLWDWLELLIIPLVLAGGAYYLNKQERELEREIAKDRQQEAALQTYIDKMSELLLEKKLRTTNELEVRDVARTRTISVMRVLDTRRTDLVIQFLREAKLIIDENSILNGADFHDMNLRGLDLDGVFLQGANFLETDLRETILTEANLVGAFFPGANMENAILEDANLKGAVLEDANLKGAVVSHEQLATTKSLQGATMPDGTKHE